MSTNRHLESVDGADRVAPKLLWAIRVLSIVAVGLSAYLATIAIGAIGPAGCGGFTGVDCDHVLRSRWSTWLGIPVSYISIAVYLAIFLLSFPKLFGRNRIRPHWLFFPVASLAGFAALWFAALQIVVLQKLCVYCLSIHACGIAIAGAGLYLHWKWGGSDAKRYIPLSRSAYLAAAGFLPLVLGQLIVVPDGFEIAEMATPDESAVQTADLPAGAARPESSVRTSRPSSANMGAERTVHVIFGSVELDMRDNPLLGDPSAEHVLVELFDYTCDDCRRLHRFLKRYKSERPFTLATLTLPVPMNTACNPHVSKTGSKHIRACELSRIALAVFEAAPEQFPHFHEWMMDGDSPPAVAGAADYAQQIVGAEKFQAAMQGPEVESRLQSYVRLYKVARAGVVPKLIYNSQLIVGAPEQYGKLVGALDKVIGHGFK